MKELGKEEIKDVLLETEDGVLSITNGEKPYGVPLAYVYTENELYLSMFAKGKKHLFFEKNSAVCFTVYNWNDEHTAWRSVIVDGTIKQVTDMASIEKVVRANMAKMGLPDEHLDRRMEYYAKTAGSESGVKIYQIVIETMSGRTMNMMIK